MPKVKCKILVEATLINNCTPQFMKAFLETRMSGFHDAEETKVTIVSAMGRVKLSDIMKAGKNEKA